MIEDKRKGYLEELVINLEEDIEHLNAIRERRVERPRATEEPPLLRKIMLDDLINHKKEKCR